ncbi:hypothetical protein WJX74_006916 [Apatococcus lobatus]|uniref:NAD-dependent epimerase/dehydratase domain-containing protein n=1 Tax=Apatococcus lobatus TaxID=904363 RepID=A0AAW1QM53_9CHLO
MRSFSWPIACPTVRATTPQRSTVRASAAQKPKNLFVFGFGYTGLAAAAYFQREGSWSISGTCRGEEKRQSLETSGIQAFSFDPDNLLGLSAAGLECLHEATHILSTVPPNGDFNQDPVLMAHRNVLQRMGGSLEWAGYISSTGVYGGWQGDWVDESSELRGSSQTATARIQAEAAWSDLHQQAGFPTHIFRLGGIYGPGRSAIDAAKAKGPASSNQARRSLRRYTSRCHVHDVCRVLHASMLRPCPGEVYNIVDDNPASRTEVMAYARRLLSGTEASAETANLTAELEPMPQQAMDAVEQKRVRNSKIKSSFDLDLQYPSFQEGLTAINAGIMLPFQ